MLTYAVTEAQIINGIKYIINKHTYLKPDVNGTYRGEFYVDYDNKFESNTIKIIFESSDPRESFYDITSDMFMCAEWGYQSEIIETVERYWDEEFDDLDYWEYKDFVCGWVEGNIRWDYPYDHFLNQEVCVDIILDTRDGDYDFALNRLFEYSAYEKGFSENSSLIWLMRQQGYTDKQIMELIENKNYQGSKLLESVYAEYAEYVNTSTNINALSFFVKMSLGECIDLNDSDQIESIILSKNTSCGLYDPWNGAGSLLEIELEKDICIPLEFIDSVLPDGCRGYGVDNIYGMGEGFWKSNCTKCELKDEVENIETMED